MSLRNKLFLSFIGLIALNFLLFRFVFEDLIVEQLKTDRHIQYQNEKKAAEKVQMIQMLRSLNYKDPEELKELEEALPEDLMYRMIVKDANGNVIFSKTSYSFDLKIPPSSTPLYMDQGHDLTIVGEYHYQHDSRETIIYFYTDVYDIMASKGVSMMIWFIYGTHLLIGLVLVWLFVRWILKPVNDLSRVTQEIRDGKRLVSFSYRKHDEFGQLFHYFRAMVDELRISEDRQSELISAVAHDFRTPLTTIKGYASYISSGRVTDLERIQKQMKKIEQKTSDMELLLDELQDFTQNNSEILLNVSRIHVKNFMKSIIEDYLVRIKEAGLSFHWKLRVSNELHIEADEGKLRRVMENLINNAIYYNKPNGSILITCDQRDGHVLFSVIDKGEGISQEDQERIFTKFYRADKSRNRNNGGTGLGLSICQSIVRRHGGEISVNSELGVGSAFSFTIPFSPA
ncbi:sensor histidine kinase [Brevibacillus sp. TJ4]|uniref:sensor histidine kinase n=1 Tax=Brevibacillus sp. TJ4 TaxID=3234853 RepID=UPI0037D6B299